ncbi:hypothetical protein [Pseudomonas sp.]
MDAKRLKFRASFPQPESYGLLKVTEVVFEHGLGPCGRIVTDLDYEVSETLLVIHQTSFHEGSTRLSRALKDNCEIKTFVYKMTDVQGRIEATR